MVASTAQNVEQYLAELPEERREVISAMRKLIRKHLPKGYSESIGFGMICYGIPLKQYPDTYNGEPLSYVALAAQKNYYALYVMGPYADPKQDAEFRAAFKAAGKKLDMGKSCVRFKSMDDLALDAVAKVIASTPPKQYIERYEAARAKTKTAKKKRA
ncbi:MAG TPA: DUF1801 domain-containing protein [Thermoanaerobaculia bacterium]|nr:DUF1801 domain-containing protein [Thermoanaerobaculia bacterium]